MALGSTLAQNLALDACYGSSHASVWPATLYLRLYNGNPMTGGTELTGAGGYAPVAMVNDSTHWPNASGGQKSNGVTLAFPTSSGAWSSAATYFWLTDGTGNLLDGGPLTLSIAVTGAGWNVQFPANSIQILST
jgi:hypothetical protein